MRQDVGEAAGVSSFFAGTGARSKLMVMIQEPLGDDVAWTPLKADGPLLPGPQNGDPGSFERCKWIGRARRWRVLADHNGPGPDPGKQPGGVGQLPSV